MDLKVELKQLVGVIDSPIGPVEVPQAVDGIYVNGLKCGYIDRRSGARIYGLIGRICPPAVWPEVARKVKQIRPDADISEYSGVTPEEQDLAESVVEEETDVDE